MGVIGFRIGPGPLVRFVFLLAITLHCATALPPPTVTYTEVYPEVRPWGGCYPIFSAYEPCRTTNRNSAMFLENSDRCELDSQNNNYLVGSPYFSFDLAPKRAGTLYFQMLECYQGPESVIVNVNGLCELEVENEGYMNHHVAPRTKSIDMGAECLVDGENRVWVEGTATFSLGGGTCPVLSCMEAPLYADVVFPETGRIVEAEGTAHVGPAETTYVFSFSIPEGAWGILDVPEDAFGFSCGGGCMVEGNRATLGSGIQDIGYKRKSLAVEVLFDAGGVYLENETVNATVLVTFDGVPIAASVYFLGGGLACVAGHGLCAFELADDGIGEHRLAVVAAGNDGRRGLGNASYTIEGLAEVSIDESIEGDRVDVRYVIVNQNRAAFEEVLRYALPQDYGGDMWVSPEPSQPYSENGAACFLAYCPPYSTCGYTLSLTLKGMHITFGELAFPDTARVGEDVVGRGTFTATNENTNRSLSKKVDISDCVGQCSWDVELAPRESKSFEFLVERGGAEELGSWKSKGFMEARISVPPGFPEIALEYFIPWNRIPEYAGNGEARLDGREIVVGSGYSGLGLSLGVLAPGEHVFVISYTETESSIIAEKKKQEIHEGPEIENVESEEIGGGETQKDVEGDDARLIVQDACSFGQTISVIVLSGEKPETGTIRFVSPSGRTFLVDLVDGKAEQTLDEEGVWGVYFGGQSQSLVVGTPATPDRKIVSEPRSLVGGVHPNASRGPEGLELLAVFLLLPLFLAPLFGYIAFKAFMSKGLSIRKRRDGSVVCIELENCGDAVTDVRVSDVLPEDAKVIESGGGSIRPTALGNIIRWRRPVLGKGETWNVRYEAASERWGERTTRFSAMDGNGNMLHGCSETN